MEKYLSNICVNIKMSRNEIYDVVQGQVFWKKKRVGSFYLQIMQIQNKEGTELRDIYEVGTV